MKKREFIFASNGNPEMAPVTIWAWDIDDAISLSHELLPPGNILSVNNRPGKPTLVDFQED